MPDAALGPDYVNGLNVIPFWWDMLIVAVFSLAIFYWAVASALPAAQVHANFKKMQAEAEVEADTFEA